MRLFTTPTDERPRWTGNVLPVLAPPLCPVAHCAAALVVLPAVVQPALFYHGGYGAARRETLQLCTSCGWLGTSRVESVNPRRLA